MGSRHDGVSDLGIGIQDTASHDIATILDLKGFLLSRFQSRIPFELIFLNRSLFEADNLLDLEHFPRRPFSKYFVYSQHRRSQKIDQGDCCQNYAEGVLL